jgi:hypothetical protein
VTFQKIKSFAGRNLMMSPPRSQGVATLCRQQTVNAVFRIKLDHSSHHQTTNRYTIVKSRANHGRLGDHDRTTTEDVVNFGLCGNHRAFALVAIQQSWVKHRPIEAAHQRANEQKSSPFPVRKSNRPTEETTARKIAKIAKLTVETSG